MRNLRWVVVIYLLLGFLPGVGEVVENVDHLIAHGHLAHSAAAQQEGTRPGREHGCSGVFHLCSCHPTLLAGAALPFELHRPAVMRTRTSSGLAPAPRHGFRRGPDRPPRL